MATFWTYDYACSLHEEWTFLLRSHWSKMKGLYIVTRYLPFIFLATNLYMDFTPNENPTKCRVLANIESGLGIVLVILSECFFILRTYVLWNKNRILLAAMLCTSFLVVNAISQIFVVASLSVTFDTTVPAAYTTSAIPGITGCHRSSTSYQLFIPFLLSSVFELGLMILTLIRAIQSWRTNPSRLIHSRRFSLIILNHSLSSSVFGDDRLHVAAPSGYLPDHFEWFTILATLATRMHLHLWHMNRHPHGSTSALVHITMSDISFANPTE
ncbi:hypothetical protein EV424DRAFT_1602524 [Suillus variegatus]|nr:hypothetical protein EV424DRAFT_1602524 [Suillus variegatus]